MTQRRRSDRRERGSGLGSGSKDLRGEDARVSPARLKSDDSKAGASLAAALSLSERDNIRKQLDAAHEALWRADRLDLPDEIRALNVQMSIAGSLTVIAEVLLDKGDSG